MLAGLANAPCLGWRVGISTIEASNPYQCNYGSKPERPGRRTAIRYRPRVARRRSPTAARCAEATGKSISPGMPTRCEDRCTFRSVHNAIPRLGLHSNCAMRERVGPQNSAIFLASGRGMALAIVSVEMIPPISPLGNAVREHRHFHGYAQPRMAAAVKGRPSSRPLLHSGPTPEIPVRYARRCRRCGCAAIRSPPA